MTPALDLLTIIIALIGALAAWAFVALYGKPPFHWQTYEAGRHLMRFTAGIAVILTWSLVAFVLRLLYGDAPWLDAAILFGRVVIFGFVATMMVSRLRILIEARKEPMDDPQETSSAGHDERARQ